MLDTIKSLIDCLKQARKEKRLSQHELAARIAVPQSHISKIEAGNVNIRLASFLEMARTLDLEVMLVPRQDIGLVETLLRHHSAGAPATPAYVADDEEVYD